MATIVGQELPLHTRQNWQIPNETAKEKPAVVLNAAVEMQKKLHPHAVLRSITARYNCVGLVVASRRTHVPPTILKRGFAHDDYRRLAGEHEVERGDVERGDLAVYVDGGEVAHVGIVIEKTAVIEKGEFAIKVMSKWGHDGEYIHDLRDVPKVYGETIEFWTDRTLQP
jgi:hypothetical protein